MAGKKKAKTGFWKMRGRYRRIGGFRDPEGRVLVGCKIGERERSARVISYDIGYFEM